MHDFIPASGEELRVRDDQLRRIFDLLRPASGIDFKQYKLPTIKRRLLRRMALQRLTDVQHYIRLLEDTPGEVRSLYQDLLIHVTRFFREPESFKALAHQVFPELVEDRGEEQPIRAWVSGCATGEEAYSLAIALLEYLHGHNRDVRIQIFATDVSETAIEHARAGVYPRLHRGRRPAGQPAPVLHEGRRRLSCQQDGPRSLRVRASGSDEGSAVLAPRSDSLPQRPDLHGRRCCSSD